MRDQLKVVIIGQFAEGTKSITFSTTQKYLKQKRFATKMLIFSSMRQFDH